MTIEFMSDEWKKEYAAELEKRTAGSPPYIYFTPEWVDLFEKKIQGDATYKEVAKDWEGSVCLHVEPNPDMGLDIHLYVLLDLWHGDCNWAQIAPTDVGEAGDFVITGSLERWIQVGRKQLDPVKGMMQGKLKLKGDLPAIVRAVRAATRLVELSTEVGGKMPDDLTPEETQELRDVVTTLSDKFL